MKQINLLAVISRQFLKEHKVHRYRLKKVTEMSDEEVIRYCHWYCEDNNLTDEWADYEEQIESQYRYCTYMEQYIEDAECCDMQMISNGLIKDTSSSEISIDKVKLAEHCSECKYCL